MHPPLSSFLNSSCVRDFHRFLDGTLQSLAERFDALVQGGTLGYENGVGSFDIAISQTRPDD
jgi:hypothetical protein